MKMNKKLLALVMSVAMLLTFMPAAAFADAPETEAAAPVVAYTQTDFTGKANTLTLEGLYEEGVTFNVGYSDGSEKAFKYSSDGVAGSDGVTRHFVSDDGLGLNVYADLSNPIFEFGMNYGIRIDIEAPYSDGSAYEELSYETPLWCNYRRIEKCEFVPADGFTVEGFIGRNYIDESMFFGDGNKFVVSYQDIDQEDKDVGEAYTVEYVYAPYEEYSQDDVREAGFYINPNAGDSYGNKMDLSGYAERILPEGTNEISITYEEEEGERSFEADFPVTITATRYDVYAEIRDYAYTGKTITPEIKMYDSNDELIDPSEYTIELPSDSKDVGWYQAVITFKDAAKYVGQYGAGYGILPKTPVIKKVAGGKKKLTVSWNKLSAGQLANTDYYVIELAKDKYFSKGYKSVKLSKAAIKKGSKTIKKLTGGKKYYVRIYAYKTVGTGDEAYTMYSADSKMKTAKTKK